jgi:hypothetical protein
VDADVKFESRDSSWIYPVGPAPGHTTVVLCADDDVAVTYESDRFGFHNPDSLWTLDHVDIAVIGDSYTAGVCVDPEDEIPAQLPDRWTTLNLGMSGAGPLRELAILREYAELAKPRLVVWVYFEGNDRSDLLDERERAWLTAYLRPVGTQNLAHEQQALDARYTAWLDSIVAAGDTPRADSRSSRVGRFLLDLPRLRRLRGLLHMGEIFPDDTVDLEPLPTALAVAGATTASWGGQLLVVHLPGRARYDTWFGAAPRGREQLQQAAMEQGAAFLDLDPVFRHHGDPKSLWDPSTGHLSAAGYGLAAQAISTMIDSVLTAPAETH